MTEIQLNVEQFPHAIDVDATVGQTVTLTITGTIRKIEDDLIDITTMGGPPAYAHGGQTIAVNVTAIERIR